MVVLATRKVGSDLPTCLPHTYRLCLSLYIPPPLICKTQFSPNLFFFCVYFYFPTQNSSPNPLYCLCSANLWSPSLLPTLTFPSRRGIRES